MENFLRMLQMRGLGSQAGMGAPKLGGPMMGINNPMADGSWRKMAGALDKGVNPELGQSFNPATAGMGGPVGSAMTASPMGGGWGKMAGLLGQNMMKQNQPQQAAPLPMPQRQWGGFQPSPWMQRFMTRR